MNIPGVSSSLRVQLGMNEVKKVTNRTSEGLGHLVVEVGIEVDVEAEHRNEHNEELESAKLRKMADAAAAANARPNSVVEVITEGRKNKKKGRALPPKNWIRSKKRMS